MADNERFSDDISELWGSPEEVALGPPRVIPPAGGPPQAPEHSGNGVSQVDEGHGKGVSDLARAISGHQVDVASRAELEAVRSDLEGAFTHQLAVALYELMAASNDRLAAAEEHINVRLDRMADRVAETVGGHADRLTVLIEGQVRSSAESSDATRADLVAMRNELVGPVAALADFQRNLRHEVGRLGDALMANEAEHTRRADTDAQRLTAVNVELSARLDRGDAAAAVAAGAVGDVAERISALQANVTELHEAVAELSRAVQAKAPSARRRWRRSD